MALWPHRSDEKAVTGTVPAARRERFRHHKVGRETPRLLYAGLDFTRFSLTLLLQFIIYLVAFRKVFSGPENGFPRH
jgi:hypothetical protein